MLGVDPVKKTLQLRKIQDLRYDKLVVSPGIDIRWGALEGYTEAAAEIMPHAWHGGPQTLLLRRQGEVLSRTEIASQVWDMNFDSDTNVIDVAIRRLRAKIDDDFEPKLIHTVRGMGYTLDVPDDK